MSSADKYREGTPAASSTDISTSRSKASFLSQENLMVEKCEFDKKACGYAILVILIMVAAAAAGIVSSMYTIANLHTYNIPVDHKDINMANVLVSRDKTLIYLPQFPDGAVDESQSILDQTTSWMAIVNRPEAVCFLRKLDQQHMIQVDTLRPLLEEKKALKMSYGNADKAWATRRLTAQEESEVGGFIWDSCAAKEMVVMKVAGTTPVNTTNCMTFCLPHFTISTASDPYLRLSQINCVPAKCENVF